MTSRRRNGAVWALGIAAGVGAGIVAERLAMRRVAQRADPERDERLDTMPGERVAVRSADGTELHCRVVGPGDAPTLVFAHGIMLDLTSWYYQWRAFSDRYRCVLYDQRGHGDSGVSPAGDYSLASLAQDLRAVLNAASPEGPVVVLGHSMGGMTIASLADLHPEEFGSRIVGAVMVDTTVSDLVREIVGTVGARVERLVRPVARRFTSDVKRVDLVRRHVQARGSDLAYALARATNFGPDASPSQVAHVAKVAMRARPEIWAHTLTSLVDMDLRHALARISVPTLVVVGDRDRITPKTSAQALLRALPRGRGIVLSGAGHLAMLERHRAFNRAVGAFLDEVLGSARAAAAMEAALS